MGVLGGVIVGGAESAWLCGFRDLIAAFFEVATVLEESLDFGA